MTKTATPQTAAATPATQAGSAHATATETVTKEPIAIVGIGCVLPDAPDVQAFWDNLNNGRSSVREVSRERWDPDLYWSADRSEEDKTYAKIGAFVADDAFDGIAYRMPPKVVEHVDPSQRWALAATRQALVDAGFKTGLKGDEGRDFDRDRCAVILGNAMGGETNKTFAKRLYWPEARRALATDPDFQALPPERQEAILARSEQRYKAGVPAVTEDTMPGHLSNVVAGRIANVFDLGGKNFTTDAACASSFAALDAAIDTLQRGEADLVVWGGSDRSMDVTPYIEFSKIGALSPDGSRPFDKDANGFVMGEGCAMFLLKRLGEAERDGDKVYAVIRGVGASSDGKGKGITAPNPTGQVKAVRRAYEDAGIDPYTIGYLEAHGTSTPVGDPVELQSVHAAFSALSTATLAPGAIAVGSVKSNIGHLKAAAGAAGLLKAVLAIHHRHIPPSINVREINPRIDWAKSPFRVQTTGVDWPEPDGVPRRAAVSSFGFGGTNFHVVLEEHVPGRLRTAPPHGGAQQATGAPEAPATLDVTAFRTHMQDRAVLEAEPLVLDASTAAAQASTLAAPSTWHETGEGQRIRDRFRGPTEAGLRAERRIGIAPSDPTELPKRLESAEKAAGNAAAARLAFNQGVFLGEGAPQGKVGFLFPGQGTQYVNMLRDLAEKYEIVRTTFHEADEVLVDDLGGAKLTDILWPDPDTPEARAAAEEKLKLTEFTQPAVLAADIAILRLLQQWGIKPDVVAGHSLGEYGALVAADVLTFADALHAVAARGREMAHVDVPDLGKMAAVPADWETVRAAIADVDGYVIPANKNCPGQTVLAGSSAGVDAAVARLKQEGLDAQFLPVSAAFHSDIVAPASAPLRRVLGRLDVKAPAVRVLSNVGAAPYGDDPDAIRDNLARQVASPVEWIDIVERMYAEGVRTFVEVGPKRALTGFALDILKDRPDAVAICSNHPKKGGVRHVNELFAFLGAWGFRPRLPDLDDPTMYTRAHRDPTAPYRRSGAAAHTTGAPAAGTAYATSMDAIAAKLDALGAAVASLRADGQAAAPQPPHPAAAGAAPDVQALHDRVKAFGIDLDDIGVSGISVGLPGAHKPLFAEDDWDRILRGENLIDVLPESERRKLADKNIVRLQKGADGAARFQVVDDIAQVIQLAGRRGDFDLREWGVAEELIASLDRTFQYAIAAGLEALRDAGIPLQRTYLKTSTGGHLPKAWKLPEPLRDETGIVFASAFPGYDNLLRDVARYMADKYAGRTLDEMQHLYQGLIDVVQDADARGRLQDWFDREAQRLQEVMPDHGAGRYEFNRKFLFEVLSMGHAQFAQLIGARGPNTQLNAACASTTQALAVAEDWIRTGRCRRVLVVGADDVTSDAMFEWIGAGFLASGAATTEADVAQAALPFDARRHGMIVGMGAVGLVVEAAAETERRGMRPIARLLATEVANSAFHGSRLDVDHISRCMQRLAEKARDRYGIDAAAIADETVFVSHETYTPARGGSASAEIHALRATFGDHANRVVIANTKGFTGHPQGAGIEDAIALKMLQRGQVPPIANFRDPDPELGDLRLSTGGPVDVRYALRLAAGFGSQVAMTFTELVAREDERVADADAYTAWLAQVSGLDGARTEVVQRTLRIVDQGAPRVEAEAKAEAVPTTTEDTVVPAAAPPTPVAAAGDDGLPPTASPSATPPAVGAEQVLERLVGLVAEQTGYPVDMLDPDLDMEADLGIDTVKQAELFGAIRAHYDLELEEGVQIKDYPTLRKVAGYFADRLGGVPPQASPGTAPGGPTVEGDTPAEPAGATTGPAASIGTDDSTAGPPARDGEAVLEKLISMVAEQTGYPVDMLDPDLDMEADLGIDTVKQAELFGAIRAHYGLELEEGVQIKDYPTLRKVAGYFAERLQVAGKETVAPVGGDGPAAPEASIPAAPDAAPTAATAPPTETPATAATQQTIVRRVPVTRPEPSPGTANGVQAGTVLVVGDGDPAFLDAWTQAGFRTASRMADGETPVGLLLLATRSGTGVEERVLRMFQAARDHADHLGPGTFVCAVTAQDGAHGLREVRDASMGAVSGLAKALRKELPECTVKAIDVHPDDPAAAGRVVAEVLEGGPRTEVCFGADGTRHVVDVVPSPLPDAAPDVAGKGIVVSGGAQGITVEMLMALAPQGPRLLLLGRTQMPAEAEAWAALDDAGWDAKRDEVMARLRAQGEKVTPVAVEQGLAPMRKAADVHRNLQRLQDAGAEVLYAPVDVTDVDAVAQAVRWARDQWGRIDGVLHAAGAEVSKDLRSKDPAQFQRVLAIKVRGWDALMQATRDDPLGSLCAFSSVAGRFGNIGQTDYAAANEYLAKAVRREAARRGTPHATTIAWGPWGQVGMATRGSILQIMEASGVTPIPTADGVRLFLAEMAAPGIHESVVAGAVGAIDVDAQVVESGAEGTEGARPQDAALEEARRVVAQNAQHFRLLDAIDVFAPGRRIEATVVVDQARDAAIRDHRVDGVPYLPGVFGIEAFAEAAGLLVPPDLALLGARDVRFALPLKQLKDPPQTATLTAEAADGDGSEGPERAVHCRLTSQFHGPDGTPLGQPKLHFEATLRFGPVPAPEAARFPMLAPLRARPDIYPPFFHGPGFQVLERAGPLGDPTVALWRRPTEDHFGAGPAVYLTHPMVTEALFQACGLGVLHREGRMCLPAAIDRLDLLVPGDVPDGLRLVGRPTGRDEDGLRTFDAEAVAPDGAVVLRLSGFRMVETGPAADVAVTAAAPGPERDATDGPTADDGQAGADTTPGDARPAPIPAAPVDLPSEEDIQFAAVAVEETPLEPEWFTADEQRRWASFPAAKRQAEWRAGRLAVKRAVLDGHPDLSPRDVWVESHEEGRPRLFVEGRESALWVSLTHRDGLAIAAVSPAPVGIDLEAVEDRAQSWLEESFSVAELRGLLEAPEPTFDATCMWAAKEAALKRAGVGLKADLRAHQVAADGGGGAVVEGPQGRSGIRFYDVDGRVLAVSTPAMDPVAVEARE